MSESKIKFQPDARLSQTLSKKFVKVYGIIVPIDWDIYGDATQLSLYTPEGEDIVLDFDASFSFIEKLINKRVEVKGTIFLDDSDEIYLKISEVRQIKVYPPYKIRAISYDEILVGETHLSYGDTLGMEGYLEDRIENYNY